MASEEIDTMEGILKELKRDELRKETSWATPKTAHLCEQMDAALWKSQDKEKFTQVFCQSGGPELLVSILKTFEQDGVFGAWETAFIVYNSLCNLSEASTEVCTQLGVHGMVALCAHNIVKYREKMHLKDVEALVRLSISILCNMSTVPTIRHVFQQEGVAEKMRPFLTGDPFLKSICIIILSYIAEEGQVNTLARYGSDTTEYLVDILKTALKSPDRRFRGLCDREIAQALGRMAVHDSNKYRIAAAGGLPLLMAMLQSEYPHTQQAAATTLKTLAACDEVRLNILELENCVALLETLSHSTDFGLAEAASGALQIITRA